MRREEKLRFVDRSLVEIPFYFFSRPAIDARLQQAEYIRLSAARKSQTRVPVVGEATHHQEVRRALEGLFDQKCAFCEARTETMPYRFRPIAAQPSQGYGQHYFWLADVWENLYSICKECAASEPDFFPVQGPRASPPRRLGDKAPKIPSSEKALLLDPCLTMDFESHLHFRADGGIEHVSPEGDATIKRYRLNRRSLIAKRRAVFSARIRGLRALLQAQGDWEDVVAKSNEHPDYPFPDRTGEFLGSWGMLLKAIGIRISKKINQKSAPVSDVGTKGFFERAAMRTGIVGMLDEALDALGSSEGPLQAEAPPAPKKRSPTLARIRVQNFKGLHELDIKMPVPMPASDPSLLPAAAGLLILGENSAGKSSILEAVALALAKSADRDDAVEDIGELILNPAFLGSMDSEAPSRASVELYFQGGAKRRIEMNGEAISQTGGRHLPPVFAYGAYRNYLRQSTPIARWNPIGTLFHTERVLSNPEQWLLALNTTKFREAMKALRFVMSIEGDFDAVDRESGKCLIVQYVGGAKGSKIMSPLSAASSGYRAILAMTCDLIKGLMDSPEYEGLERTDAIVLIDEIEAHLHPRWKMQIMRSLRRAFPRITFIATTHDPLCLRGAEDGEVRVLNRIMSEPNGLAAPGAAAVELLDDLPRLSELTIEQLLTSDHFGLFTTDKPELEEKYADALDLLRREKDGDHLLEEEQLLLQHFRQDIGRALPIGSSEAHRMVQWAVAGYLSERRQASAKRLTALKDDAKRLISAALEGI